MKNVHNDRKKRAWEKLVRSPLRLLVPILLFPLAVTSCGFFRSSLVSPGRAITIAAPTSVPTPTSASASLADDIAYIDQAGLDIAERRVVDVYQQVAPSVVSLTTQVLRRNFFFEVVPEEGAGSGFVLDTQGHILTNYHVIEGAQEIDVSFSDETVVSGTVVGVDPRNDIAVVRVDAPPELLLPIDFGASAALKVGQRAIAIGNPFGQFGRTLTTGVISALNRSLAGSDGRTITGIIQTDAAINRGNSGGPLLDSSGRVIGITTAIFSPTGASAGVGFAVPIDTVKRLLPDLLALGRYRHPWLGVRYAYSITPRLAEILELSSTTGLLLVQLNERGPLAQAGILGAQREALLGGQRIYLGGDIRSAIDEHAISSVDGLETFLEDNYHVGDTATVSLLRDSQPLDVSIELAEDPN